MDKIVSIDKLRRIAFEIRKDIINSLYHAGSGHLGGSLGLADIFTCLYFNILNHKPNNPNWEYRDRLILSIGHVAPVLYASLANSGYFDKSELITLRQLGSRLQGHPGKEYGLPGIEISSGSLGQGLSISVGIGLASKIDNKNYNIFTIMGDGELQEGSVWESAMSASFHKIDNLTAIVDRNYKQIDGNTEEVMNIEPLKDKWTSFGWDCHECDGNNIEETLKFLNNIKNIRKGKPKILIAKTIMGKGVSSIENDYNWHGKAPNNEEFKKFICELEKNYEESK